jgi:ribosome-binding protein aMBF1 (putative translation factor)
MINCDICGKDCSNNYGNGTNIPPLKELDVIHICNECAILYNKKEREEHERYNNILTNYIIELKEKYK